MNRGPAFVVAAATLVVARASSQESTAVDAAAAVIFAQQPATRGAGMECRFMIDEIDADDQWAPSVAIALDEGEATDADSRYVQVDLTLAENGATVIHSVVKGGFEESYEEPFLMHQRQNVSYSLGLHWAAAGEFRYSAQLGSSVLAMGRLDEPRLTPTAIRATVSGMRADISCRELELE